MQFEEVPTSVLLVPVISSALLLGLSLDGQLSRADGGVLLVGFVLSILFLVYLSKKGLDVKSSGEVTETLEEADEISKWKSLGLFFLSLFAIIVGSEMVVSGSENIIAWFGLSDTVFGMTILALLVSIEELARELPAAMKGRPEISYGNVAGSILAFFLFNAGIIALVQPVPVNEDVLTFYLPLCLFTVVVVSFFMLRKRVSRWAGGVLLTLYLVFFVGGYIL
jgi:cation:H+ antiporter